MKKVLIIGGADSERTALKSALEAAGYHVSAAVTRKYTNRWLGRRIKPFDLIIYDLAEAPQNSDFWPELRESAGATPVLVLTSSDDRMDYLAMGMTRVVHPPYKMADLVRHTDELLA